MGKPPRIISTFLESYDFSGKTIIPFCTSHSSGIGSSASNLHSLCSDSTEWIDGRRFESGVSKESVQNWIGEIGIEWNKVIVILVYLQNKGNDKIWLVSEVLPDYYLLYKGAGRKERTAWPQHTAKWRLSVSLWSTGMLRQGSWAGIWCCKAHNIKWRCDFHIWLSQPGEFSSWRATSRTTIRSLPANRRNFIFLQFFYGKQFIFIRQSLFRFLPSGIQVV